MPRIKRWFPVSHDINRDPEMWDLCDRFGDKALRCWLEILSIADRNEGVVPGDINGISRVVSWAIRCKTTTTLRILYAMIDIRWLDNHDIITAVNLSNSSTIKVTNWSKYHRTWEPQKLPVGSLPSEPPLPNLPNQEDKNKHRASKTVAPLVPWPSEDLWLKTLIEQQAFFKSAVDLLTDFAWWEDVAGAINGIDPALIEPEFAKISAWLRENPGRKPTRKGMRRFVRTWLEKARENQRGLHAVKKR